MATLSVQSTGSTSVTIAVSGLDTSLTGVRLGYIVYTQTGVEVNSGNAGVAGETSYILIGGLSPQTTYKVEVYLVSGTTGASNLIGTIYATTSADDGEGGDDKPEPYFAITDYTATSVTIRVRYVPIGNSVRIFIRLALDESDVTVNSYVTATMSSFYATYGGLTPSTRYFVNVDPDGTGSDYTWLGAQGFTTLSSSRPENWSWVSTVESGRQIELTYKEWNEFCARINEFRAYKGLEEYSFETVYSGTPMYARIINQARTAIDELPGHGALPPIAVPGGYVSAFIFNELKDALNHVE